MTGDARDYLISLSAPANSLVSVHTRTKCKTGLFSEQKGSRDSYGWIRCNFFNNGQNNVFKALSLSNPSVIKM